MMRKLIDQLRRSQWLVVLLLLFCVVDLAYSGYQHYHFPIDGDVASVVLPKEDYQHVLADPLGLRAVLQGERYPAPNRFFCHYTMKAYFTTVPRLLAKFTNDIDKLYWSTALFKTFVQLLLLLLLGLYVHSMFSIKLRSFLVVLLVLTPFFQTMGYNHVFGIIDQSITYTFFYAWPFALLLLFYYPFFRAFMRKEHLKLSMMGKISLGGLALVVPFSSPIVAPVILLVTLLYGFNFLRQTWLASGKKSMVFAVKDRTTLFYLVLISVIALYSLYLGQFNSENAVRQLPLWERYLKIPQGLWSMLTIKLAYPVMLGGLLVNWFLLAKRKEAGAQQLKVLFQWALLFFALYLLLLPLGGYRAYRLYIVRKDTILPIISGLIVLYGITAFYLLKQLSLKQKGYYSLLVVTIAIIFTTADGPNFDHNTAERAGLKTLMESGDAVVPFAKGQLVLSWDNFFDPQLSENNARLIQRWGITDTVRLYYNLQE